MATAVMTNQRDERQAGTELREIEITPEMIEAGFKALCASPLSDEYLEADKVWVGEIFRAMIAAHPQLEEAFLSLAGGSSNEKAHKPDERPKAAR